MFAISMPDAVAGAGFFIGLGFVALGTAIIIACNFIADALKKRFDKKE